MNINPNIVIKRKIISNIECVEDQVQQNGIDLTVGESFVLKHGEHKNFVYNEKFDMQGTFGFIKIRSSFARKGFILSSGLFDAGFKGTGGCVLHNFSGQPIFFNKGERVAQMIVFKSDHAKLYDGHYQENKDVGSQYE